MRRRIRSNQAYHQRQHRTPQSPKSQYYPSQDPYQYTHHSKSKKPKHHQRLVLPPRNENLSATSFRSIEKTHETTRIRPLFEPAPPQGRVIFPMQVPLKKNHFSPQKEVYIQEGHKQRKKGYGSGRGSKRGTVRKRRKQTRELSFGADEMMPSEGSSVMAVPMSVGGRLMVVGDSYGSRHEDYLVGESVERMMFPSMNRNGSRRKGEKMFKVGMDPFGGRAISYRDSVEMEMGSVRKRRGRREPPMVGSVRKGERRGSRYDTGRKRSYGSPRNGGQQQAPMMQPRQYLNERGEVVPMYHQVVEVDHGQFQRQQPPPQMRQNPQQMPMQRQQPPHMRQNPQPMHVQQPQQMRRSPPQSPRMMSPPHHPQQEERIPLYRQHVEIDQYQQMAQPQPQHQQFMPSPPQSPAKQAMAPPTPQQMLQMSPYFPAPQNAPQMQIQVSPPKMQPQPPQIQSEIIPPQPLPMAAQLVQQPQQPQNPQQSREYLANQMRLQQLHQQLQAQAALVAQQQKQQELKRQQELALQAQRKREQQLAIQQQIQKQQELALQQQVQQELAIRQQLKQQLQLKQQNQLSPPHNQNIKALLAKAIADDEQFAQIIQNSPLKQNSLERQNHHENMIKQHGLMMQDQLSPYKKSKKSRPSQMRSTRKQDHYHQPDHHREKEIPNSDENQDLFDKRSKDDSSNISSLLSQSFVNSSMVQSSKPQHMSKKQNRLKHQNYEQNYENKENWDRGNRAKKSVKKGNRKSVKKNSLRTQKKSRKVEINNREDFSVELRGRRSCRTSESNPYFTNTIQKNSKESKVNGASPQRIPKFKVFELKESTPPQMEESEKEESEEEDQFFYKKSKEGNFDEDQQGYNILAYHAMMQEKRKRESLEVERQKVEQKEKRRRESTRLESSKRSMSRKDSIEKEMSKRSFQRDTSRRSIKRDKHKKSENREQSRRGSVQKEPSRKSSKRRSKRRQTPIRHKTKPQREDPEERGPKMARSPGQSLKNLHFQKNPEFSRKKSRKHKQSLESKSKKYSTKKSNREKKQESVFNSFAGRKDAPSGADIGMQHFLAQLDHSKKKSRKTDRRGSSRHSVESRGMPSPFRHEGKRQSFRGSYGRKASSSRGRDSVTGGVSQRKRSYLYGR